MLVTALGEAGHASTPHLAANAVPRLATLIDRIAALPAGAAACSRSSRTLFEALGADPDGDLDAAIAHVAARSAELGRGPARACSA